MIRNSLVGTLFFVVAALLLNSCHKEYFELKKLSTEIELEPELVAPLIYGSMKMADIVALLDSSGYMNEYEDGLIYLVYSDTIFSVSADTAVVVPDMETSKYFLESDNDVPVMLPGAIGDTFFMDTRTSIVDLNLEGDDRLDSVLLKGGSLQIELESSFKHKGVLIISSDQIRDEQGVPYKRYLPIDDTSGNFHDIFVSSTDNFSLQPIMRNDSSMVLIDFDLGLINSGAVISPGEQCVVQFRLDSAGFYNVFGYIDPRNLVEESGSVDIPLWNDNPDLRSITFADPRLEILTFSSVGVPFAVDFDSVIATGEGGSEVTLTLNDGNVLEIMAPGTDQIGETVITQILINNSTSNIQEFLATAPSSISYSLGGRVSEETGTNTHFLLDTSKLEISLEFQLPLDFKSSGFALTDTMEFELGEEGIDTTRVKYAQLTVGTVNELPIELELQVYLLDQFYQLIDSVFNGDAVLLAGSEVDAGGKLIVASEAENSADFTAEKLVRLKEVKYMQVVADMITSGEGEQDVKIYSDYTLDFDISMVANLRINTGEL